MEVDTVIEHFNSYALGATTVTAMTTLIVVILALVLALISKIRSRHLPVESRGLNYDSNLVILLKHLIRKLVRHYPTQERQLFLRAVARASGAVPRTYLRAALSEAKEVQAMAQTDIETIDRGYHAANQVYAHQMRSVAFNKMELANTRVDQIRRALGAEGYSLSY